MRRIGSLLIGLLLATCAPAFSQDTSRGELSAGWRHYHATVSSVVIPIGTVRPDDFPKGWYADVAVNLSPMFAIVGEAGGTYRTEDTSTTQGVVTIQTSSDIRFHTFVGGVRVRAPQVPAFVPFGQVLFGGEHDTSTAERTITVFQTPSTIPQEGSSSSAVLTLDAGVTASAGPIGVRVAVGYARFFSDADADALRVSVGAAFRF